MDVELADLLIVLMLHSALIKFWSILVIIPSLLNSEDKLYSLISVSVYWESYFCLFVSFGKDFVFNECGLLLSSTIASCTRTAVTTVPSSGYRRLHLTRVTDKLCQENAKLL